MNEELKKLLEETYKEEIEAQIEDDTEAEEARKTGEMPRYYDLSLHLQLPDTCWALEKWDEAKRWYRHNARLMMEKRAWHAEHSGPDYPMDAILDWEAVTLVKAGDLQAGREHLKRAIAYFKTQPANSLAMTQLGLHAAQAGLPELATYAKAIIDARQELPGGQGEEASRARKLLHYEPSQVNLMLGQWDELQKDIQKLAEGERLVEGKPGLAFPDPLQNALVAASRGLRTLASVKGGELEPKLGQNTAREAFEAAMLNFYRFGGRVDWNLYFMRLNTRFADELATGRPLNPTPFADGWSHETR